MDKDKYIAITPETKELIREEIALAWDDLFGSDSSIQEHQAQYIASRIVQSLLSKAIDKN